MNLLRITGTNIQYSRIVTTTDIVRLEAVNFLDKMLTSRDKVFRAEDVSIVDKSVFIDKTLGAGLLDKKGITVVAIRKVERYIFNPSEEERLERGYALIVVGEADEIRKVK